MTSEPIDHSRECISFIQRLVDRAFAEDEPDIVAISVALGALESSLTDKKEQRWPINLHAQTERGVAAFERFTDAVGQKLNDRTSDDTRAKVKSVADEIWLYLTAGFSKDIHHAQHIHSFTRILEDPKAQSKRQLDCAGVVTSTLAACKRLARRSEHSDLTACRLQVSEDHCWINFDPEGGREGTVEVTTDTTAKRGKVVAEGAWRGWLYTGGHAILCSPKMTVTALIASLSPSIVHRQNTGVDSEQLQGVQRLLLTWILRHHPDAMYPAALCALADLQEISDSDDLQNAVRRLDVGSLATLLDRRSDDAQTLFEEALEASRSEKLGSGRCWYPHSYWIGFLTRRAEFILRDAAPLLGEQRARALGDPLLQTALASLGSEHAASALRHYRFLPVDEQLHKDVEGLLEMAAEIVKYLHGREEGAPPLSDAQLLTPLLELWDGVCCCWAGKPKPPAWTALLLRTARLFTAEARAAAASSAKVSSGMMSRAQGLWEALKANQLRQMFEAADLQNEGERVSKRARR